MTLEAAALDETEARVRRVLAEHGQLGVEVAALESDADLYAAGMTSRASVNVMLGLEAEFQVEFPDSMLRRDVFESIGSITDAVALLSSRS